MIKRLSKLTQLIKKNNLNDINSLDISRTILADERTKLALERTILAERRTKLANERTLLAYTRTGLSIVALGFGLTKLFSDSLTYNIGVIAYILGLIFIIFGLIKYYNNTA